MVVEDGAVVGVGVEEKSSTRTLRADSVVIASGGFESNPQWREGVPRTGLEQRQGAGASDNTRQMIAAALAVGAVKGAYNESIDTSIPLDPNVKDGRAARVDPPKSHWATPLETGPFYVYPVTCGITLTFGGLFSGNYPGGSGLAASMVFGRRAGRLAPRHFWTSNRPKHDLLRRARRLPVPRHEDCRSVVGNRHPSFYRRPSVHVDFCDRGLSR